MAGAPEHDSGRAIRLAVERGGQGPCVVLLHGLGLDRRTWEGLVPVLHDAGFSTAAIDARGHGRSPVLDAEVDLDDLAADVRLTIEEEAIERPHLLGLSMGGMIAMRLAGAGMPLSSLTLVSTSAEPEERRALYEPMAEAFRSMPPSIAAADAFLAMQWRPSFPDERPLARDRYRRIVMEADRIGVHRAALAVLRRPSFLDRLGRVVAPTLILAGQDDLATPPICARHIATAIGGARLLEIESAAHLVHEEQAAAFARATLSHLREARPWT